LFKRKLSNEHIGLAVGECVAHLNFLHQRGQVSREVDADGHYVYRSVDDTLPQRLRQQKHRAIEDVPVQV
jgi:hypothetical protein